MAFGESKSSSTAVWLFLFFAAAIALRIVFSVGLGHDDATGNEIFTGNDPNYHHRTLEHLLETGHTVKHDPALNYPEGRTNPNPPYFVYSAYPLAKALDAAGNSDPAGLALNIMTAIWGALIVFPVFLLARDLWGRGAGLWAAFFAAISAPYIQRSTWGYADHDGYTMFFITLAFLFMVKAFRATKAREYVTSWTDGTARAAGLKSIFTENKAAFRFAAYAGLALSACALAWKGYPYALAVLAVGAGLQMIADHLRNKDATATFLLYLVPLVVVVLVPYLLFYRTVPEFMDGTIFPSLYVLVGVLVAGLVLVPTRQIPSVLVFPALLVAAGLGLVLMLVVFPDVGYTVFSGLGYFNQSKLYTTIAEAQRAELGFVAASFGFFTFLLGFWGFGKTLKAAWKGQPAMILTAAWAVVAFFMAFAASRFIMNAVPIFATLIGVSMVALFARLGFADVGRRWRAAQGQPVAGRAARSLGWKSGLGAGLVALFLIVPNVWIGVDAATPSEFDAKHGFTDGKASTVDRMGAFGISFDLRDNGWLETMNYLATLDTGVDLKDRPAVIAWWDYGHWTIDMGDHPTVADPFQSHYELAGRFLASESESEGVSWLTILLLSYDYYHDGRGFSTGSRDALESRSAGLADAVGATISPWLGYDAQYKALNAKVNGTAVFGLYDDVKEATGKDVGYLAADIRMYPFNACNSGIFYAPVFLANKNPDDFLKVTQPTTTGTLTILQYGFNGKGDSYRLSEPKVVDANGKEWTYYQGYAYQDGKTPLKGYDAASGVFVGDCRQQQLQPTAKFSNSMFARAFNACSGLEHWRAIQETRPGDEYTATVLCQYYNPAKVQGRVTDANGNAMPGAQVAMIDGFGGVHGQATTDASGQYSVDSPPSSGDDLKLTVLAGGQPIFERTDVQVSAEQARTGATIIGKDLQVGVGNVAGRVFEDKKTEDGTSYNAANDTVVAGATVTVGGKTAVTDASGQYNITSVAGGQHTLTITKAGFNNGTKAVVVATGKTANGDQALTVKTSLATLRFRDNGAPVASIPITVTGGTLAASGRQVTTGAGGNATLSLAAGDYVAKIDHKFKDANGVDQQYTATQAFSVGPLGAPVDVTINRA